MGELNEKDVLDKLLESNVDNEIKQSLMNFYFSMRSIKQNNMVKMLNYLDELSEDCDKKKLMRGEILDNYNELPRKTLKLIDKLIKE